MKRVFLLVWFCVVALLGLGGAIEWWSWRSRAAINPYVEAPFKESELWAQASYMMACRNGGRCVPPLKCIYDYRVRYARCLTSECWTDQQCNPGYACRDVAFTGPPPFILKMCVVEGAKKEGELCEALTHDPQESCARGLSCQHLRCGRSCNPGDASTCPVGFKCFTDLNISTCVPDCVETGCPNGERCYQINKIYSVCGVSVGQDCDKNGCPEGQTCEHRPTADEHRISTWCRTPCERDQDCPDGTVCTELFGCLRKCSKATEDSCGPDYYCVYGPPRDEGQCYPGN